MTPGCFVVRSASRPGSLIPTLTLVAPNPRPGFMASAPRSDTAARVGEVSTLLSRQMSLGRRRSHERPVAARLGRQISSRAVMKLQFQAPLGFSGFLLNRPPAGWQPPCARIEGSLASGTNSSSLKGSSMRCLRLNLFVPAISVSSGRGSKSPTQRPDSSSRATTLPAPCHARALDHSGSRPDSITRPSARG